MRQIDAKTDSNGTAERQPLMHFTALTPKAAFIAPKMRLVTPSPSDERRVESDGIRTKDALQNDDGERTTGDNFIVSFYKEFWSIGDVDAEPRIIPLLKTWS